MLKLRNLSKSYNINRKQKINVLTDINLTLSNKGLVLLVGKTGCGKSTLVNLIGGLEKPDKGDIIFNKKNISKFKTDDMDYYRNQNIGFVFQENSFINELTVLENIALAIKIQKREVKVDEILNILEELEIDEYANEYPSRLSGGEQQRVSIARALVKNPQIIIADEPTSALDDKTSMEIIKILKNLSKKHLVILISHNENLTKDYADQVIRMENGQIISNIVINKMNSYAVEDVSKKKVQTLPKDFLFKIAYSNYKSKISVSFIILFVLTLTFALLGSISSLVNFDYNRTVSKSILEDYNEIGISYKNFHRGKFFLKDEIPQEINDFGGIAGFRNLSWGFFPNGNGFSPSRSITPPATVELTDDFIKNFNIKLMAGNFPKNDNEICIPYFICNFFGIARKNSALINNPESCIGQEIKLKEVVPGRKDCYRKFTICGIIDTKIDYSFFNNFNTLEEVMDFLQNQEFDGNNEEFYKKYNMYQRSYSSFLSNTIHSCLFVANGFYDRNYLDAEKNLDFILNIKNELWYSTIGEKSASLDYTWGDFSIAKIEKFPYYDSITWKNGIKLNSLKSNQIVIPQSMFRELLLKSDNYLGEENFEQSLNFFKEFTLSNGIIHDDIKNGEGEYMGTYEIMGFYKEKHGDDLYEKAMFVSDEFFENIKEKTRPFSFCSLYFPLSSSISKCSKLLNFLEKESFIEDATTIYSNYYLENVYILKNTISSLVKILSIGASVFLIFVIIMIYNYISNNINTRKGDIGTLISLGTTKKNIFDIYFIENFMLTFIAYVLSIGLSFGLNRLENIVINKYFARTIPINLEILDFNILGNILILIITVVISMVSVSLPLIRLFKKSPSELIRKKF